MLPHSLSSDRLPGLARTHTALAGWVVVILIVGLLPLRNFVGHPHWGSIAWTIPPSLWHSRRLYFDLVANVGLFYPLGLLLARLMPVAIKARTARIIGAGALLSLGIEFFQIYCHNRHPSPYDVASNVIGTGLGLWTAPRLFSCQFLRTLLPSKADAPH